MKRWMQALGCLLAGVLAAAAFLYAGRPAELPPDALYTIDSAGNLYLLTDAPALVKTAPDGTLEWTAELPVYNEQGDNIRYSGLVCDHSGSVYIVRHDYRRQVNARQETEEVTLAESVRAFHADGEEQTPVLTADLTGLSQYSTENYILSLRAHGDSLLAVCFNQGQYEILRIEPYEDALPQRIAAFRPNPMPVSLRECTALSTGEMVYTTAEGGLFMAKTDGTVTDLRPLTGEKSLIGRISADETDCVYYRDLSDGTFRRIHPANGSVERIFSALSVVDGASGVALEQVRDVQALGGGAYAAALLDGRHAVRMRFDASGSGIRHDAIRQKTGRWALGGAALCGLAAAGVLWLIFRRKRTGQKNRLTGRILFRFLPVYLAVLAAIDAAAGMAYSKQVEETRLMHMACAARTAARLLPADTLRGIGARTSDSRDRGAFLTAAQSAADDAAAVTGADGGFGAGLVFYALDGGQCFGLYAAEERDSFYSAPYLAPLSQEFPADTAQKILDCAWEGGSVSFYRDGAPYLSWFEPVTDASGLPVGLVEARMRQTGTEGTGEALRAMGWLLAAAMIPALWLLAVLKRAFRPLRELERCIDAIGAGDWNVRARISSHDELAEIGGSFNRMTEKLRQYISGMVLLNKEYVKFLPRELFRLMEKEKISDLAPGDNRTNELSILYIRLCSGSEQDSAARFARLNERFDPVFQVVDRNHGVIQHFDGGGITALFAGQTQDALNAAISLKGMMEQDAGAQELRMLIASDETLIGVAGNEKRQTIAALSPTLRDLHELNALMEEMGVRYVLTERVMRQISGDVYFTCREIGSGTSGRGSLYEFLDGMEPYEKKLRMVTKDTFEQGVHAFAQRRYAEARKCFAGVLQVNEQDKTAMYYLLQCDRAKGVTAGER